MDFAGAAEDGGVGGAVGKDFGGPVEEAVAVLDEIWEGSDKWVEFEACCLGRFGFSDEEEVENVERDEEDEEKVLEG